MQSSRQVGLRIRSTRQRARFELLESRDLLSTDVTTYRYGPADVGQNNNETVLTPANVNSGDFGKLQTTPLDGQVYAQPLYMENINITTGPSPGLHNVVFVATMHDSLYAVDANSGAVLWQKSFIDPAAGVTTVPNADNLDNDISPEIGILSTPVIDPATNTLYTDALTKEIIGGQTHYIHRLHAIDMGDGSEKFGGPDVLGDTILNPDGSYQYVSGPAVNGTGSDSVNGVLTFNAKIELQRVGLSLVNGVVYIAFASYDDNYNYHGWILGVDAQKMTTVAAFNDTPNGTEGGIWQSGGSIASDADGNLYLSTGNGTFDSTLDANGFPASGDYGDSVIKLAPDPASGPNNQNGNGWGLKVVDYFSPYNTQDLNTQDLDLGASAPVLLPDSAGSAAHPHLLLTGSKAGTIYLIDRDNMGKFNPQADEVVQEQTGVGATFSPPSYFDGNFYVSASGVLKSFSISNGAFSGPTAKSSDPYNNPKSALSVSADGSENGIVWGIEHTTNQLRAYDATNVGNELYTSDQASDGRDQLGTAIKFSVPTVADGQVFVGTSDSLVTYGLLLTLNQKYVSAVYESVLHRSVDPGSMTFWSTQLDNGASRASFVNALTHSDEYFGDLIQSVYSRLLGRAADSGGVIAWTKAMHAGLTDEQLEADLVASPEFYANSDGTDLGWVDALYQKLLGRAADSPGANAWVLELAQGVSRTEVASHFASSSEREYTRIQGDYQQFLGRNASNAEVAFWVNAFQHGMTNENVVSGFVASDEYFKLHS